MLDKNIYRNSRFCHLPFAIPKSMKNQHQPQLQYIQKEECKNQSTKAHRTEAHKSIFSNIVHLPDGDTKKWIFLCAEFSSIWKLVWYKTIDSHFIFIWDHFMEIYSIFSLFHLESVSNCRPVILCAKCNDTLNTRVCMLNAPDQIAVCVIRLYIKLRAPARAAINE